jgi:hypothetical protein
VLENGLGQSRFTHTGCAKQYDLEIRRERSYYLIDLILSRYIHAVSDRISNEPHLESGSPVECRPVSSVVGIVGECYTCPYPIDEFVPTEAARPRAHLRSDLSKDAEQGLRINQGMAAHGTATNLESPGMRRRSRSSKVVMEESEST